MYEAHTNHAPNPGQSAQAEGPVCRLSVLDTDGTHISQNISEEIDTPREARPTSAPRLPIPSTKTAVSEGFQDDEAIVSIAGTASPPQRLALARSVPVMTGESDLRKLLSGMRPQLDPGRYVFTTVDGAGGVPSGVTPVVTVSEQEGLTMVVRLEEADAAGLPYDYVAGWITLRVHSALEAVGLTAAVAKELADIGLSCNVVAGFHHDHLFVPYERSAEAVAALEDLARRSV